MTLNDRRTQRTRRRLQYALVSLIAERGYESLTVQAILDRADVGRATFYAHYRDKRDLLDAGIADLAASFAAHLTQQEAVSTDPVSQVLSLALPVIHHAAAHRVLYTAMAGTPSGTLVIARLQGELRKLITVRLTRHMAEGGQCHVAPSVVAQYLVAALFGLLLAWLDQQSTEPPTVIAQHFVQLATPTLVDVLR